MKPCSSCLKRPPIEGKTRCPQCLKRERRKNRNRYARRRAAGLCGRCGAKAEEGLSQCSSCAFRSNHLRVHTTIDCYDAMLQAQKGVCAICQQPERIAGTKGKPKALAIDHCHESGKTRGLLCDACNKGLGCFEDRPERLNLAVLYLFKHAYNL